MPRSGSPESSGHRAIRFLPSSRVSQSRLHNFIFPTAGWGRHQLLRCIKLPAGDSPPLRHPPPEEDDDDDELMGGYHVAMDKIEPKAMEIEDKAVTRPWNLRTRRAVCGAPAADERRGNCKEEGIGKGKRPEFSAVLRPEEVEEDLRVMLGERFNKRRKSKKQSQKAKKLLDMIYPGAWLMEVTLDTYKVEEDDFVQK